MAILDELAARLSGRSRAEENIVSTDATTRTYIGTATSDSSDGSVYVALSEDVTMPDDYDGEHGVGVEMPTTVGVSEGDEVIVTTIGGGTMKAPVVTGNPGWGDAVQEQVNNAESIAEQAEAVANATGQHFWPDDDGVHVTEVTQEAWNDSTSTSYHSGANVLLNALGQLFRDGLNNLLALVAGSPGHTYSFTIENGVYSYPLPFGESIAGDPTISVGGHTLPWSDCQLQFNYENAGYSLLFSGNFNPATYAGQTATMTYSTSSSLSVFDGLGTAAQNIISFFDARGITLLGGRGVIQGNTSKQVGNAITEGGAVVGYNVMDVNVIRLANSSPDPDDAYAYLAIRANETYVADVDGEKVEGDVDYWRSNVQLVSKDGFGKVSVGLGTGMVGLQGDYLALSTSDTSTSDSFPMANVILALTNAAKSNTWVAVSAANWATMNSGYSITASDMKYNAYQRRIIGSLTVRETTGHSAGNNVCGTVKAAYRPPARQIIHTTTNGAYKMFVDAGGGLTIVLGSATSANTDHWFALDYIVNG